MLQKYSFRTFAVETRNHSPVYVWKYLQFKGCS